MTLFWKNLEYVTQKEVLFASEREVLQALFEGLDIETILDTKILHKDLFEKIWAELFEHQDNEKSQTWVQQFKLFEKFGGAVDYELKQDEFLRKMKQEQFQNFQCHTFFQKTRENYLQVLAIENTNHSLLTLEDCADFPKVSHLDQKRQQIGSDQMILCKMRKGERNGTQSIEEIQQPDTCRDALKSYQITHYRITQDGI